MGIEAEILTIAGMLIVAVITPGPNNIIVFQSAVTEGFRSSAPLIAGIVCGSLIMFLCSALGIGLLLKSNSFLVFLISTTGSAYLIWLGINLVRTTTSIKKHDKKRSIMPNSFIGLAAFQFANPKSWILMGVVSTKALPLMHWLNLMVLLIVIFVSCLLLWAYAGVRLNTIVQKPSSLMCFNRIMGATLILFASILLWPGIREFEF